MGLLIYETENSHFTAVSHPDRLWGREFQQSTWKFLLQVKGSPL